MAKSIDCPGDDYDLVAFFDCFHDMGDPDGAAASHVLQTLRKKGWYLNASRTFCK